MSTWQMQEASARLSELGKLRSLPDSSLLPIFARHHLSLATPRMVATKRKSTREIDGNQGLIAARLDNGAV